MKSFLPILLLCCCWLFISCGARKESPKTSGNPLFDGWYADPEVSVFGGKYWIYPTYSNRFEKQVFFDAFSSEDLITWQKHERILDTTRVSWAKKAMWAPCVVENDGRYFLFFSANDLLTPEVPWWNPQVNSVDDVGGIGVAVADLPQGPYQDYLSRPLIGEVFNRAQPIDQFVFKDVDGQFYIIYGGWGHCNIGKLSADFTGLVPFAEGNMVKEITPDGYVEGPVLFVRRSWYYLMWSEGNWTDGSYRVAYGRSKSVLGPYPKMGVVLQGDTSVATGAGHHSVLNLPGTDEWYAIYHRRPIPNLDRDHRVTCIDRMYFDEDGAIQPIKITNVGVEERKLAKK